MDKGDRELVATAQAPSLAERGGTGRSLSIALWLLVGASLYDPLQYDLVYLPIIVPRLPMWPRFPLWYDAVVVTPPTVLLYAAGFLLGRPSRLLMAGAGTAVASVIFRLLLEGASHDEPGTWAGRIEFAAFQIGATWFLAMVPLALGGLLRFRPRVPSGPLLPWALRIAVIGMVAALALAIVLLGGYLLILRLNGGY